MTPHLTALEIASGFIVPRRRTRGTLPSVAPGTTPRAAFEETLLAALLRPPCLVSFSGGRDSSAVLAVATHVARREGLPLPIPASIQFPALSGTHESEWQEQVIAHLGLPDWFRTEATTELDCVGPVATAVLRRHGILWPCNAYFHVPLFEAAAGGSLATGLGGDEAFSTSTWSRERGVLRGAVRPQPRDVLRVGFALTPAPLKYALLRGRVPALSPWLRPAASREVTDSIAREAACEPVRWDRRFRWLSNSPYLAAGLENLGLLAADSDVQAVHPFFDGRVLSALARLRPDARHASRADAMERLVGDLLPPALLNRSTKARFDEVFWQRHARELVADWDGEGVDPELVDLDVLRREWSEPAPDTHSSALLQSVWLARQRASGGELQQQVSGAGQ